jgi:AraC-like DNA-binding protein
VPPPAYSVARAFEPAPPSTFEMDRHYLLYMSTGMVRLEDGATTWSLPPARAALVAAGRPIIVTIPRRVTTASVLIDVDFAPAPPSPLSVFDVSPLARELFRECSRWDESTEALDDHATAMFRALIAATWELAAHPSAARMPSGRSPEVRRALELTAQRLDLDPSFDAIAAEIGLAPRSLARRFQHEIGMPWRAALRQIRVLQAIELLATTDDSITTIALASGYSSLSGFQSAFRELTGNTPSEYRASFRP